MDASNLRVPERSHAEFTELDLQQLNELYDKYKDCLLSAKYYGRQLARHRKWNMAFDISTAVLTSSTLATQIQALFGSPQVQKFTVAGLLIVTLISIIRPFLRLGEKIDRVSKIFNGYRQLTFDVDLLVGSIRRQQAFTDDFKRNAVELILRYNSLSLQDEEDPNRKNLAKFEEEVRREVPDEDLWRPRVA